VPDRVTLSAFTGVVLLGGMNFVGVRIWNREMAPLFGSATRFIAAGLLFFAYMRWRKIAFPRGEALFGALVYGVLSFTLAYALAYWALLELSAGVAAVLFASVPLLTMLIAPLHGIEPFRLRGLIGAVLAMGGIAILADPSSDVGLPLLPTLAILVAALANAEAGVILKRFPPSHPVATNATAMLVGATLTLGLSALFRESWTVPESMGTWAAFTYLVIPGSIGFFALLLFTLGRWTASGVAYIAPLMPIVTMIGGALIAGEAITASGALGGAVVLAAVYIGALWRPRRVTA
jgi:drug/metabolite transporter (DMT)-like permease